jgi:hypothetical protein
MMLYCDIAELKVQKPECREVPGLLKLGVAERRRRFKVTYVSGTD